VAKLREPFQSLKSRAKAARSQAKSRPTVLMPPLSVVERQVC
jgi:hypothetical protein